jgi:hypothetical protein
LCLKSARISSPTAPLSCLIRLSSARSCMVVN